MLPCFLCRRRSDHIQNRNLLNTLCDDDDYGHNGIDNGNIIMYGDQGQSHHGGGYCGGYEEYGSHDDYGLAYGHGGYSGQAYSFYSGPVGRGGYGNGGRGKHDFIKDLATMVLVVEEDMEVENIEVEDMVVVMVIKDLYNYLKS